MLTKRGFDAVLIIALLVPVALVPLRLTTRRWVTEANGPLTNLGAAAVIGGL